ncbi:formate dehydrogenase [Corynebacterium tapiri]|nr:formate dehydrogenase [Corynebacterium tapiri]
MANADCIVIQGSNMAEAHPVGFQWVMEAKKRGARIIHVDPRFTRTSAVADKYIGIRAGSDVVLFGALITYMIENDLWFKDYVLNYTNASTIVNDEFRDTEDLSGLYSGFNEETGTYDLSSWSYKKAEGAEPHEWEFERDETLEHPNCVFQLLKRHYSRYTPEMVEETCGISREDFEFLAQSIAQNSGRERTTQFAYALGWTQHTLGAQFIRACAILQLLMGNVGRPGSGIMALRGHASIQGSTDIPTLFHILPGYIPMPTVGESSIEDWFGAIGDKHQRGFWQKGDAYAVSLLKAYFGDAATPENDFGYEWLPKLTGPASTYHTLQRMQDGGVDGYMVFGQNPAVAQSHGYLQRTALAKLKWMVVRDFQLIETATFWKDSPEILSGALKTEDIETEVFYMPAANHVEKSGTFTQTQRLLQWRFKAKDAPGDATSELDFFYELGQRIKAKVADSDDPRDLPLKNMTWDYALDEHGEVLAADVLKEINGYHLAGEKKGQLLDSFGQMRSDGSTSGGCWIYTGVYAGGINRAAKKTPRTEQGEMALDWGWAWPMNRRILYNRASADPQGKPWSERKKLAWWDEKQGRWESNDVVDFPPTLAPGTHPEKGAVGPDALDGNDPFIMQPDGKGWLFAPTGMVDGPMPTHYEPHESPVDNALYEQQQSPTRLFFKGAANLSRPEPGQPGDDVYPFVFTTYRLTEHYTSGAMSRALPFLAELQPELFCEVSPDLAQLRGLENAGWATIISPRGLIEARVLVTERMPHMKINGKEYFNVGLPFHFGNGPYSPATGDSPNDLLGITLDPNTSIQASKVGACEIIAGRRPRGEDRWEMVKEYQRRANLSEESGNLRVPQVLSEDATRGHRSMTGSPITDPAADDDAQVEKTKDQQTGEL